MSMTESCEGWLGLHAALCSMSHDVSAGASVMADANTCATGNLRWG